MWHSKRCCRGYFWNRLRMRWKVVEMYRKKGFRYIGLESIRDGKYYITFKFARKDDD